MMDQYTADLLIKWGLIDYVSKFEANRIDAGTLQTLDDDDIKELIPIIGDRSKLKSNLLAWRAMLSPQKENENVAQLSTCSTFEFGDIRPVSSVSQSDLDSLILTELSAVSDSQSSNIVSEDSGKNTRLYKLLDKTNDGKSLLKRYRLSGQLEGRARNTLCNIIIKSELDKDPNCLIHGSELLRWAHEIADVFKKESPSTYYTPYIKYGYGLRRLASGKLQDSYNNRKREYRKAGLASTSRRSSSSSMSTPPSSPVPEKLIGNDNDNTEVQDKNLWLQNSSDPWEMVESYWTDTSCIRLKSAYNKIENETLYEYFNRYPALKKPNGYQLLIQDFNYLYPNKAENLFTNIVNYKSKILEVALKRANNTHDVDIKKDIEFFISAAKENTDIANLAALLLLPNLVSGATTRKRGRSSWKPSKAEIRDGFITQIRSVVELEETVSLRKEKLRRFGLTFQPLVIYVGESIKAVEGAFVVVDCVYYKFENLLVAIDTAFKIFHATGAYYPNEASGVWHFIQKGLYDLTTQWDRSYSSVSALLTEVGIKH